MVAEKHSPYISCAKVCLKLKLSLSKSMTYFKGGLPGPMISDVRDYYIDNFRFPTL